MLHVLTGDGRGKTSAALGTALRMAGHGRKVLIVFFLKDGTSGENAVLARIPEIRVLCFPVHGFYTFMTGQEQDEVRELCRRALEEAGREVLSRGADMLILDEINVALQLGCLREEDVRNAAHPMERGVLAREGVEY